MTDQSTTEPVVPESTTPPADNNSFPTGTPEEMRNTLFKTMHQVYTGLITVAQKLPLHPQIKVNMTSRFDEGYMWAKEGIALMDFNVPAKTTEGEVTLDGSKPSPENEKPVAPVNPQEDGA